MPTPLAKAVRDAILADIRTGMGCNATARKHHVSPGTVSKIARQHGHWFERCTQTALAASSRRVDCALARVEREEQLTEELFALPQITRQRDGRETKAARRLSYKFYDLHRHHR